MKEKEHVKRSTTLRDGLSGKVPDQVLELLPRAFDTVGTIAIVEIPKGLEKYEKVIASTLLEVTPSITTVVKKVGGHSGTFRRQKVRVLAGKRVKSTIHCENGIRLKVHVENTYFSARTATERMRVATLVRPGEEVLVMFSGIAPFVLVIAKNSTAKRVVGVEINPKSHALALESLEMNKRLKDRVELYNGDVRKIMPKLGKFDRILMPLPKDAEEFMDMALGASHAGTVIHYYTFCKEEEIPLAASKILPVCEKLGRKCRALRIVKAGQTGVREYRISVDIEVMD